MKLGINDWIGKRNRVVFPSLVDSAAFGTATKKNVYPKTKRTRIENLCDGQVYVGKWRAVFGLVK